MKQDLHIVYLYGLVVIEVKVKNYDTESVDTQLLHQRVSDIRNRKNPWAFESDKLYQLRKKGIVILSSQQKRQTVFLCIWCPSRAALQHIQKLYESKQLRDVFFENINLTTSTMLYIDGKQFKKTVGKRP